MASTGVAVAGMGLIVASAWTSGRGKQFLEAVGTAQAEPVVHLSVEFLFEAALVGILAFAADTSFRPAVIAVIVGLWLVWAVTAFANQKSPTTVTL